LIALEGKLAELVASSGQEAFRVEDFGNGFLGAVEHDAGAEAELANAGLNASVEEGDGQEDFVLVVILVICLLRSDD
jgi:hypothetical protein